MNDNSEDAPRQTVFARGETDADRLTRFVAGSAVSTVAQLGAGVFGFLWTWAMGRMLGPNDYGILGPFQNAFFILVLTVSFGIPQSVMTFISHHFQTDPDKAMRYGVDGAQLLTLIGVACLAVAAAAALGGLALGKLSVLAASLTLCMGLALFGRMLYFTIYFLLAGYQRLDYGGPAMLASPFFMCIASPALVWLAKLRYGPESRADILAAALGLAGASLFSYFTALTLFRKTGLFPVSRLFARAGRTRKWGEQISFGWKTAMASIGYAALTFLPSPLVLWFAGKRWLTADPEQNLAHSGYFSQAMTWAMAATIAMSLGAALTPAISEAHAKGQKTLMETYYRLALKYCMLLMCMLAALYGSVIGPIMEMVLGPRYPAEVMGKVGFFILLAMAIGSLYLVLIGIMIGIKRPIVAAASTLGALTLQTVLFFAVGSMRGGIYTLAGMFALSQLAGFLSLLIYLLAANGLKPDWGIFLRPAAAGLAVWAVLFWLHPESGPKALLLAAAGAAAYFPVAGFFGCFNSGDFRMLNATLESLRLGFLAPLISFFEKLFQLSPLRVREMAAGGEE